MRTAGVMPSFYSTFFGCISLTLIATWKTPSTCPQAVAALAESSREEVKAVERFMILVCFTEIMRSMVNNVNMFS